MKKQLLVFIGLISFSQAIAQDSTAFTNKKNELNIGYFNAFYLRSVNNFGIGYKHLFRRSAIRTGVAFQYRSSKLTANSTNEKSENTQLTVSSRLGYEFHQTYNRLLFFYGIDLVGSHAKDINKVRSTSEYENNTFGIGLSPLIGLKFFINKRISISTETSFDLIYKKSYYKNLDIYYVRSSGTDQEINTGLNPLGILSVNVHF